MQHLDFFAFFWSNSRPLKLENSSNKKTPEGVYAGCVGVRKNYRYVEWQWDVE